MIERILSILTLLMSGLAFADVPNTFQAGDAIKASEMNENFTAIDSEIEALNTRTENVSDLETKVANLEGQLETLQSLVNSVAETASTDVEFVGFSEPTLFGHIGLKAGRSACPNLYPDSHICSDLEMDNLNDWSDFNIVSPFLLATEDYNGNPCQRFRSSTNSYSGYGYMEAEGMLRIGTSGINTHRIDLPEGSPAADWVTNNTLYIAPVDYQVSNVGFSENKNTHSSSDGRNVSVSVCNITIPAACCK